MYKRKRTARRVRRLRAGWKGSVLAARPSQAALRRAPQMGRTAELFLIKYGNVIFAPGELKRGAVNEPLTTFFDLEAAATEAVDAYLSEPTSDFMAIALLSCDRVLLLSPVTGLSEGEAVAVLVHVGMHSVARVLHYSFPGTVALDDTLRRVGESRMRASDEVTYLFLSRLLQNWRRLFSDGGEQAEENNVSDRRQLSLRIHSLVQLMMNFVGVPNDRPELPLFPLAYPFRGTWNASRAAWMLLLIYSALYRRYGRDWVEQIELLPDNEHFLPMFAFASGNRARLPQEFDHCAALAERHDMFFDVRRKQNRVLVRLCPMTLLSPDEALERARAQAIPLGRLHAMAPFWGE